MSHTYRFITAQMSHIYFPYYRNPPCTCLTFTILPVPTCHNLPLYHRERVSHLLLYHCPCVTNLPLYYSARVSHLLLYQCPRVTNLPLYHRARVSHLLLYQCPRVTTYHFTTVRVAYIPPIHYFPITSVSSERIIIIIDRFCIALISVLKQTHCARM